MAGITLETAQTHLDAWLQAELATSTGQSYQIGSRQLTRANLAEIRQQVIFWERKVKALSGKGKRRVFGVIPRDL